MGVVSCRIATGEFNSMPIPGLDTEFDVPYNIITDAIGDSAATIYATGVLPLRFSSHPDNIFATVRRIACHREAKSHYSRAVWRAIVHYSSVPLTEKEEQQAISPLDRPAEIDWEDTPYQIPVIHGVTQESNGLVPPTYHDVMVPIVNSAGDPPDPVPEMTDYYWVANVTKNVANVPSWVLDDYSGSINAAPYVIEGLTVLAESSRLSNLKISRKLKENDVRYRTISFSLEFRARRPQRTDQNGNPLVIGTRLGRRGLKDAVVDVPPPPFNLELADIGLHKWDPAINKRVKFFTDDTPPRPVSQPILMNGSGDKLADPNPYNMVFGNWRIHKTKDFTVLPLT